MVEVVGTPADGLNAAIYKFEGKDFEAKMSVAAMLPGGIAATTAKYAKGLKLGDKLVDGAKILTKNADEVAEGAVKAEKALDGAAGTEKLIEATEDALKHADVGDFTINPKTGQISKMKGGGHGQANIDFLEANGIEYNIEKTYSNGVRTGNVPSHKAKLKRNGINQAWFPENWTTNDIKKAGEYVANLPENINVADGKIGTVFPDAVMQP